MSTMYLVSILMNTHNCGKVASCLQIKVWEWAAHLVAASKREVEATQERPWYKA